MSYFMRLPRELDIVLGIVDVAAGILLGAVVFPRRRRVGPETRLSGAKQRFLWLLCIVIGTLGVFHGFSTPT